MARLKSKVRISLAALMVNAFDLKSKDAPYDWFVEQAIRLLPKGTTVTGIAEIIGQPDLFRSWMVEYDAPFFTEDFEFEMKFERKCLAIGTNPIYEYSAATEIIPLKEDSSENPNS